MDKFIYYNNLKYEDISPITVDKKILPPCIVTLSSEFDNDAYKIFDDNSLTTCRSSIDCSAANGWVLIDFGAKIKIDLYAIEINSDYTINSWKLQASNDNITFEDINVETEKTIWGDNLYYFVIENPNFYRYYKIQPTKKNGSNSVSYTELKFFKLSNQGMKFFKTKLELMPDRVENLEVAEIHFVDDGSIRISKNDGTFQKMNGADFNLIEEQNNLLKQELESISQIIDKLNGEVIV